MKMEAICSSETSVLIRTTRRRHIAEDGILWYIICSLTYGKPVVQIRSEILFHYFH
jgi:hypothetical protein